MIMRPVTITTTVTTMAMTMVTTPSEAAATARQRRPDTTAVSLPRPETCGSLTRTAKLHVVCGSAGVPARYMQRLCSALTLPNTTCSEPVRRRCVDADSAAEARPEKQGRHTACHTRGGTAGTVVSAWTALYRKQASRRARRAAMLLMRGCPIDCRARPRPRGALACGPRPPP